MLRATLFSNGISIAPAKPMHLSPRSHWSHWATAYWVLMTG